VDKAEVQEIIACADRWKATAAKIGCTVQGFDDDHGANLFTPDNNIISVGRKFRAVIDELAKDQTNEH